MNRKYLADACMEKVFALIQKEGRIKYSKILQRTRMPKEQLIIYLDELERSGKIQKYIIYAGGKKGGRPAIVYTEKKQANVT